MVINDFYSTSFQVSIWKYGPHTPMQGCVLDLARAYKPHYSATSIYHYRLERQDTISAATSNSLIEEVISISHYYAFNFDEQRNCLLALYWCKAQADLVLSLEVLTLLNFSAEHLM